MRLSITTTAILFVAGRATLFGGSGRISPRLITDLSKAYRYQSHVEEKVRRDADVILNHALHHQRNVIPSPTDADIAAEAVSPRSERASSDTSSTWDKDAEAACTEALSKANDDSSNPSGIVACYNIRSFNNSNGTFQADLRLYQKSPPMGDWASVSSGSRKVKLECSGASLNLTRPKNRKRDDELLSWPPVRRATRQAITLRRSAPTLPQKLQDMSFDGKVHDDEMGNIKDAASARAFLIPTITLSGTAKDNKPVTTIVSSNQASFVHGVFANGQIKTSSSTSPPNPSGTAMPKQPFVLPGKTLGIFPVGFVITGVWALLFVATVGAGTVDRVRFREAYRRRVKREATVGLRMI